MALAGRLTRHASRATIAGEMRSARLIVVTLGMALQLGTPDPGPPTALEQALIEHVCTAKRAGTPGSDAYDGCLSAQLLSMRADFGRDLGRLSASERKTIDLVCSKVNAARGRDAYLACLNGQLASWRDRWRAAHPAPAEASPSPSPPVSAAPAIPAASPRASSRSFGLWIGVTVVTVLLAAVGVLLVRKTQRPTRKCKVCGVDVPDGGELCQKCRHEAAEARRLAAAERAHELQAKDEERRAQQEREEEQRRERALQEEEHARRQREREEEEARQRAEKARQREEEIRVAREIEIAPEAFDPYVVLGVAQNASQEEIDAAYQAAKSKYDPDQLGYLSAELQEIFKEKAQAVDRAYQMLTA